MDKILNFLLPVFQFNIRHPKFTLSIATLFGLAGIFFALRLTVDTDIASLLPPSHPSVQALERLQAEVGGETEMQLVISSPSFEANRAFAEAIIPPSMELIYQRTGQLYFSRFEFTKDTEVLKDYALYLATDSELDELELFLEDEIEDARLAANPFFVDFEDDWDDDEEEANRGQMFADLYTELIPDRYPINADSTSMLLRFIPTGSRSDLAFLRNLFRDYDNLIAQMDPQSFHPDMVVLAGGRLQRHLMEIDSIMNDVYSSFSAGIGSVLLLVMIYFFLKTLINYRKGSPEERKKGLFSHIKRMPVPIVLIGIPLLISLLITFGVAGVTLGSLNTMTAVLFVILFGLGIDYGLHFYARYLEIRSDGENVEKSLLKTYYSSGRAIMTSAITTGLALFVLIYADFRGFSEFGFISGMGIVLAYLAMIYVLPAFIVLFERYNWILINRNQLAEQTTAEAKPQSFKRYPFAKTILAVGIAIIIFVAFNTDKLRFEYDFSVLEPEFSEYMEFRELSRDAEGSASERRNPAYVVADSYEEVERILQAIRHIQEERGDDSLILGVEALQERFPINEQAEQHKLERLSTIRELLDDPFLASSENEDMDRLRRASQATEPLDFERLPDYLTQRFLTRDGEIGRFVMIYPNVGLGDGRNSIAFKNEIGRIVTEKDEVFYSASTSIVAASMLDLMQDESFVMVLATFIMIFFMMLISFRSLRWAIISLLPLVIGLSWLFFIMILFGLSFNFYNLVTLPAILGIGNDNGVHLASRYREEGPKSMWNVLASTGQHISIGSFTTMLGFAGLLFTMHPGLYSIGLLAVIGIGMTLLAAVTFLPALVQVLEDNNWINFN
ncbi:MAG: MMPL family transporter [Balneolales bacterium]|nr:MMPL family transporter [Balneolales bacterium]